MKTVPLFGRGFKGKSSNVTAQRRVNLYLEQPTEADRSDIVLYSRPGLTPPLFTGESQFFDGPMRGFCRVETVIDYGTPTQQLIELIFSASGNRAFVSVNNPKRFLFAGSTILTSSGTIVYADNGFDVVGVDGTTGYLANYSIGSYAQNDMSTLGVVDFPFGARTIGVLAGRYLCDSPDEPGKVRYSGVADGTDWDPLNFFNAETIPDALKAVYIFNGAAVLFGTRSIEWWQPSGSGDLPFSRVQGAAQSWGLYDYDTIQQVDDSIFFVASKQGSELEIVAMNGYTLTTVSTPDVEYDINLTRRTGGNMSSLVLRSGGHTWYVLSLPTKTWVYDAYSKSWDTWSTINSDGTDGRFCGERSFVAYNRVTVSDYRDSSMYGIDPDAVVDGDDYMVREVVSRHIFQDLERLTVRRLQLDMETGVGTVSGQGLDPQVMMQVSHDGGHTWGNEAWASIGKLGNYLWQAVWRRLGRGRDFTFKFRITDPVKTVIIGASMNIDP